MCVCEVTDQECHKFVQIKSKIIARLRHTKPRPHAIMLESPTIMCARPKKIKPNVDWDDNFPAAHPSNKEKRSAPSPAYPSHTQEAPKPAIKKPRRPRKSITQVAHDELPLFDPAPSNAEPPKQEAQTPRKKKRKFTLFSALLYILSLPFRFLWSLVKNYRLIISIPLYIFLSVSFVGLVVSAILIFLYGTIANRYDISEVKSNIPERTQIFDRKNRLIGTLHGENRRRIPLAEVPPIFVDALLLREDSRFYSHGGVDWIGVGRAVAQVVKHKRTTQGASTLTMQLAKITYNHQERNLHAKLTEVALAKRIEATYSKDEILETYINRIFWGHTFLGIAAAARGYYDKEPKDLSLAECATLAGIIYGPNDCSPIKHPERAKKVRDIVLGLLKEADKITEEQYQNALQEPILTRRPQSRSEENYAMGLIRRELDAILEEEDIRLGGLIVYTTLDLDLQNQTLDAINKHMNQLEARPDFIKHLRSLQAAREKKGIIRNKFTTKAAYEKNIAAYKKLSDEEKKKVIEPKPNYIQSAAVIMDNSSGALLSVVGGRDAEESMLNRAIQSRRQIGSLFKPFVYTTFFQQGYHAGTMISDNRIATGEIKGATNWHPRNSDGSYRGMQSAAYGLIKSRNTMSVRVGNTAGLKNVVRDARLAGFNGSVSPSLYLGTWEASPLDLASAYSIFANGGVRPTPYIIDKITDAQGVLRFNIVRSKRQVYTQRAANITSGILQKVCQTGGTAGQISKLGFTAPCAGKTGTTNNYTNAWFAGYTSNLTCCVWVGFDTATKIIEKGYGGTLALPIWVDIMKASQAANYPANALRTRSASSGNAHLICRESNKLATAACQYAKTAYLESSLGFKPPTEVCTQHTQQTTTFASEDNIIYAEPVNDDEDIPLAEPVDEDIPDAIPL